MPRHIELPFTSAATDIFLGQEHGLYTPAGGGAHKYSRGHIAWLRGPTPRVRAMFRGLAEFYPAGVELPWGDQRPYPVLTIQVTGPTLRDVSKAIPSARALWPKYIVYGNLDPVATRALILPLAERPDTTPEQLEQFMDHWIAHDFPAGEQRRQVIVSAGDVIGEVAASYAEWPNPAPGTTRAVSIGLRSETHALDWRLLLSEVDRTPESRWPAAERFQATAATWLVMGPVLLAGATALPRITALARLRMPEPEIPLTRGDIVLELIRNEGPSYFTLAATWDREDATPGVFVIHGRVSAGGYWIEPAADDLILTRSAGDPSTYTRPVDLEVIGAFPSVEQFFETHLPFSGLELREGDTDDPPVYEGAPAPDPGPRRLIARLREVLEQFGIMMFVGESSAQRKVFGPRLDAAIRELQISGNFPKLAREISRPGARYPARLRPVDHTYEDDVGLDLDQLRVTGYLDEATLEYLRWIILRNYRYPRAVQERKRVGGNWVPQNDGTEFISSPSDNIWWWSARTERSTEDDRRRFFAVDVSEVYQVPDIADDPGLQLTEDAGTANAVTYRAIGKPTRYRGRVSPTSSSVTHPQRVIETAADLGMAAGPVFDVIRMVALREAEGSADVVQGYDAVFASLPLFHYALAQIDDGAVVKTELAGLLTYLREHTPHGDTVFNRSFWSTLVPAWSDASTGTSGLRTQVGTFVGFLRVRRLDPGSGDAPHTTFPPPFEDRYRWFTGYQWFYRFVTMLRASEVRFRSVGDSVECWENGWRKAMAEMAQIRIRYLQSAPWSTGWMAASNVAPVGGSPARLGDVFKSRATMALLLRWHVRNPGQIMSGATNANARVGKILRAAVQDNPAVDWHPTTADGVYDTTLWTGANETALAHAIRIVSQRAEADGGTGEGLDDEGDLQGLQLQLSQMWPAGSADDPGIPTRIPRAWAADRTFPAVGGGLPTR